jgi:hypothetical protein
MLPKEPQIPPRSGDRKIRSRPRCLGLRGFATGCKPSGGEAARGQPKEAIYCSVCGLLGNRRDKVQRAKAAADAGLSRACGNQSPSDYNELRVACEELYIDLEIARLEFERHQRQCASGIEKVWLM